MCAMSIFEGRVRAAAARWIFAAELFCKIIC
jgi:hypothetical protein